MSKPAVTLRYWACRGRVEFLRCMLHDAEVAFTDERLTRDDMKNWTDQKRFVDVAGPFGMLPLLHWTDADEDAEVKGSACAVMRPVIAPHELIYLLVSYCAVGTLLTYTGRRNALPAHCFPDAQHRSVPAPQTLVSRRVFTPPLLYLADSCHVVAISGDFG
mmetsp:Transcript_30280/g.77746  ORF Transcript_30280/g.77746 Transcript_30280/m.77746 type:complete len:161 (+) Transcript_30280:139-621(+)